MGAIPQGLAGQLSQIYSNQLGRTGFGAEGGTGVNWWADKVRSGEMSLDQAQQQIANSPEAIAYRASQQPQAPSSNQGQVGLAGAESALEGGARSALASLEQGYGQAIDTLDPIRQTGMGAYDRLGALSGALGPEAQAQAYSEFASSPGQDYLRQQAERAITRNAAATGGLGGGNVLKALQENAIGLAQQDYGNQFTRLMSVAQPGLTAAGNISNLQSNLGQQGADIAYGTGQNLANYRMTAGRDLANLSTGLGGGLANLASAQGTGLSNIFGSGGASLANLLSGYGQQSAQGAQSLQGLLSNIATLQPALQGIPGTTQTQGQLGNLGALAGGLGTLFGVL